MVTMTTGKWRVPLLCLLQTGYMHMAFSIRTAFSFYE